MSTRSLTIVHADDKIVMNMYRQSDGYPSGHGKELAEFLLPIRMMEGKQLAPSANGAGCLAAQIVAHFKDGPGGIYLEPTDANDCWQDYEYHIYVTFDPAPLKIRVIGPDPQFEGGVVEFLEFCNKEE